VTGREIGKQCQWGKRGGKEIRGLLLRGEKCISPTLIWGGRARGLWGGALGGGGGASLRRRKEKRVWGGEEKEVEKFKRLSDFHLHLGGGGNEMIYLVGARCTLIFFCGVKGWGKHRKGVKGGGRGGKRGG